MPNKGRRVSMRIVHRHHFSSALKRMSAIVSLQNPGSSSSEYIVTVKGAPETLRSMVSVRSTLLYIVTVTVKPVLTRVRALFSQARYFPEE